MGGHVDGWMDEPTDGQANCEQSELSSLFNGPYFRYMARIFRYIYIHCRYVYIYIRTKNI